MRILIVGGGIAGLTLAAKLRQQGRTPVVIEKAHEYTDIGYGIGLYPLGSCVLHGLGVYDDLVACGLEVQRYEIADHTGEVLQSLDMSVLTNEIGPMYMLSRTALIDLLRKACGDLPIRMGTTVSKVEQTGETVHTTFSDGTQGEFDVVVSCDGIHSDMRKQVFGAGEKFDSEWTCWTWWGSGDLFPPELVREYWGRGWFFGGYPLPVKVTSVTTPRIDFRFLFGIPASHCLAFSHQTPTNATQQPPQQNPIESFASNRQRLERQPDGFELIALQWD